MRGTPYVSKSFFDFSDQGSFSDGRLDDMAAGVVSRERVKVSGCRRSGAGVPFESEGGILGVVLCKRESAGRLWRPTRSATPLGSWRVLVSHGCPGSYSRSALWFYGFWRGAKAPISTVDVIFVAMLDQLAQRAGSRGCGPERFRARQRDISVDPSKASYNSAVMALPDEVGVG